MIFRAAVFCSGTGSMIGVEDSRGRRMIRFAIVEDDAGYRRQLREFLQQYAKEQHREISIQTFTDGDEIAERYKAAWDIILMDIEMRFLDGMSAAEKIREVDHEVIIIFITNMPQYAIKGYKVQALDYILKPVSYFPFSQSIGRAVEQVDARAERKFITINHKSGRRKIDIARIRYIDVLDHDLCYHTLDGDFVTKTPMKEAAAVLEGEHFFQCNKGYLVNLAFVDGMQGYDVMIGADVLQVSRSRKKALMDAMNDYLAETGK